MAGAKKRRWPFTRAIAGFSRAQEIKLASHILQW
jgi:hypothetical protein